MSDKINKMLDALRAKNAKSVGRRGDIYLADYRLLNNTSAHLLFGYDASFGPPSAEDVQAAVVRDFEGRLTPVMASAKVVPEVGVKIIAEMVLPTRPMRDSSRMVAVASTMFIDQEMGETWSVVEGGDGHKFLQRKTKDDIDDILKERRSRMAVASKTVSFGNTLSAGIYQLAAGDEVRFYADSALHEGSVTKVDQSGVAIKTASGNYQVAPEAVVELLKISTETEEMNKQRLLEFYTKVYGPEFAKKMVSTHPGK